MNKSESPSGRMQIIKTALVLQQMIFPANSKRIQQITIQTVKNSINQWIKAKNNTHIRQTINKTNKIDRAVSFYGLGVRKNAAFLLLLFRLSLSFYFIRQLLHSVSEAN